MPDRAHELEELSGFAKFYTGIMTPLMDLPRRRLAFYGGVVALLLVSMGLLAVKLVEVKMLPFDNKSEFQVVLDLPEGATLETSNAAAGAVAAYLRTVPEVTSTETYAGTSAPFNFNGLVRHYFMRRGANVADVQVNLLPKGERSRQSHDIAVAVLPAVDSIAGDWVQAKYTFAQPIDLSQMDIFGLSLIGNGGYPDDVDLMFADVNNVFYGAHFEYVNDVRIWMKNLALPKKLFYYYFQTESNPTQTDIDWSHINRFFVVVKRPNGFYLKFDNGQLVIDHLQADRAADWLRQQQFEIVTNQDTVARNKAVSYIFSQQRATGLIASWKEKPNPKAWLYDEALALIVLSREGIWLNGIPQNEAALVQEGPVTLLDSARDEDFNQAVVLQSVLKQSTRRKRVTT